MTRQEFIERTAMEITEEEMGALHEVYSIGSGAKDTFCQMVRRGGEQLLEYFINLGRSIVAERAKAVKEAIAPCERSFDRYEQEINAKDENYKEAMAKYEELSEFVYETSLKDEYEMKESLKEKAKDIFGEGEYYAKFMEDFVDLDSLDSDDRNTIASLLRR